MLFRERERERERDEKCDIIITDPPYGVAYVGKTKDELTIQNDDLSDSQFLDFLINAFYVANIYLKQGGVFYIWLADGKRYIFENAMKNVSWQVRECLIWAKNQFVMSRQDYHWQHEPCLYGWKEGAAHIWRGDRKQTTLLHFDKPSKSPEHPTSKPVEMIRYLLSNSSDIHNVVLDCFSGSGTTLMACEETQRICRAMDIEPHYVDVAVERWQKATGKQAVLESTGETYDSIKGNIHD